MSARNIRCTVVRVPTGSNHRRRYEEVGADLLPWADPYIAQLVQSLQDTESASLESASLEADSLESASLECHASESRTPASSCQMEARPPFDARYVPADRFGRVRRW